MNYDLSIIIPVYNLENYIQDTLSSILNSLKSRNNIEILLIDDGSTDSSLKIIKGYEKKYKFIKVISKNNGGVCSARNLGIKNALGRYILFLDGDDLINENFFENIDKLNFKTKLILGSRKILTKSETKDISILDKVVDKINFFKYMLNLKINFWNIGGYIVEKELLINNDIYFDESLESAEDLDFFMKIIELIDSIELVSFQFFIYMNNRVGSVSLTFSEKRILNQLFVCTKLLKYFEENQLSLQFFIEKYIHIINEAENLQDRKKIYNFIINNKLSLKKTNFKQKIHLLIIYKLGLEKYFKVKKIFSSRSL